jgi:hypothetical protein
LRTRRRGDPAGGGPARRAQAHGGGHGRPLIIAFISEVISAQRKSRACTRAALPQPDCLVGTELRMLEAHAWVSGGLSSVPAWVYPGSTAQPHGGQAHLSSIALWALDCESRGPMCGNPADPVQHPLGFSAYVWRGGPALLRLMLTPWGGNIGRSSAARRTLYIYIHFVFYMYSTGAGGSLFHPLVKRERVGAPARCSAYCVVCQPPFGRCP